MEINLKVEVPGLVEALESLAVALANQPKNPLPTSAPVKETITKEESNVAKKIMYFQHEGTDELLVVQKGESLDFLTTDIFDELTKAEYVAKTKALQEPVEDEKDDAPEITLVTVRSYLQKLQDKGKQKEAKGILVDLGYKKLSDVSEDDYPVIIAKVEELLA